MTFRGQYRSMEVGEGRRSGAFSLLSGGKERTTLLSRSRLASGF